MASRPPTRRRSGDDPATIVADIAAAAAAGIVEVPIAATYPLERVADAYAQLEQRHTRGKIILVP